MEQPHRNGHVTVTNATVHDHGIQFIGNPIIGTFNSGPSKEDAAWRQWEAVLRWLSPSDDGLQQLIHDESRRSHKLKDAGLWFINSELFKAWIQGRSRLTWVNGEMGCGKTVLFFLAVEKVREICRQDKMKSLGYFYCTSRGPSGQDIEALFRTLLRHICSPPSVPAALKNLYESCDQGLDHRSPTVHELATTLKEVLAAPCSSDESNPATRDYYLLIDGLDELELSSFYTLFQELLPIMSAEVFPNVHILVASRNQGEIKATLSHPVKWNPLPVDTVSIQEDIREFVISEIQSYPPLRRLQSTHDAILKRVADESKGMFRWAYLQVQSLKALGRLATEGHVEAKLRSMPQTLDETYYRMLNNLDETDKPRARRALTWLVYSGRQLYIEELADACGIDLESSPIDRDKLDPVYMEPLLQDLILIQPPLSADQKVVKPQTHTVMLVHASIREFLLKKSIPSLGPNYFALQEKESNVLLAQSCLTYLLHYNTYNLRHSHGEHPLLRYAWYHWEDHFDRYVGPCVPTIPTAMLRRKARMLFRLINSYIDHDLGDYTDEIWSHLDEHEGYASGLLAFMNAFRRVSDSQHLDLRQLKLTLNIPYFHPAYDKFCPPGPTPSPPKPPGEESFDLDLQERHTEYYGRNTSDLYRPMGDGSIRLVEILPAIDPDTTIQCRLFETKLEDSPPYAAISYVWGSQPANRAAIMVDGHEFDVKPTQLTLLRNMRSRTEGINQAIWIDWVCINHTDMDEGLTQVKIMSKVFSQAREVVVGLGSDDDMNDAAVLGLSNLASAVSPVIKPNFSGEEEALVKKKILELESLGLWTHILQIFQSSWWYRSWVIQDIVLSNKAVILFGTLFFNFDLVEQVMLAEPVIRTALKERGSGSWTSISETPGWHAAKVIVHSRFEYRQNQLPGLPSLLWRFHEFKTADSRDQIYALLEICSPQIRSVFAQNYTLDRTQVALQVSRWFLDTYRNLDILSVRSAFEKKLYIPEYWSSWMWSFEQGLKRQPLDLGVFLADSPTRIYSAAGNATQVILAHEDKPRRLAIRGRIFDRIRVIGVSVDALCKNPHLTNSLRAWSEDANNLQSGAKPSQNSIEVKWRTMLANQWPLGEKLVTSTYRGAKVPPQTPSEEEALLEVLELQRDIDQAKGRQLIVTAEGRMGLASSEAKIGDWIAIFPGGSLPYIMRAVSLRNENSYVLVGECYVHGCMDGQIVQSTIEMTGQQEWWTDTFQII